jgi:hypothetical protein
MVSLARPIRFGALVLAVYALVLLGTPALHHDYACHVQTPGHCQACTANPLASSVETGVTLRVERLPEVGRVEPVPASAPRSTPVGAPGGRAPPA